MPDISFDFSLKINGVEIAPEIRSHLGKLEYEESLTDTSHLDIDIRDCEFFGVKRSDFDLRAPLRMPVEFSLGYIGKLTTLLEGDIAKIEPQFSASDGSSVLRITCKDVSARMKREPQPTLYTVEKFPNAKVIAQHVIAKYGFEAVLGSATDLRNWGRNGDIDQINKTDWEILSEFAENLRLRLFARGTQVFLVDDDYLLQQQQSKWTFIQRADRTELTAPVTAPLLAFTPNLASTGQRLKCEVKGWASMNERGQFDGTADLKDFYSDGKSYTNVSITGDIDEILHIRGVAVHSSEDAYKQAVKYLRARADRLVTGQGKIMGNAAIRAGSKHAFVLRDLGAFGKEFSGDYWITAVRHRMSADGGFETTFDVRRDGLTVV